MRALPCIPAQGSASLCVNSLPQRGGRRKGIIAEERDDLWNETGRRPNPNSAGKEMRAAEPDRLRAS
jgi:hypothetical protein